MLGVFHHLSRTGMSLPLKPPFASRLNFLLSELNRVVRPGTNIVLISDFLSIDEQALQWDELPDNLRAGDSLGVTLSMEATGLPAGALPADLLVTDSSQYKIYADEAVRDTRIVNHFDGKQLVGRLLQRFVIIPEQPGALVMPALAVAWWDIEQAVERIARIESRVVQVAPSDSVADDNAAISDVGVQPATPLRGLLPAFAYRHWPWLTALAVGLLMAAVFAGAGRLRTRIGDRLALAGSRRRCRQRLRRACHANDAGATRRVLIEWGRLHWADAHISGLHYIEVRAGSPELIDELARGSMPPCLPSAPMPGVESASGSCSGRAGTRATGERKTNWICCRSLIRNEPESSSPHISPPSCCGRR
ncbi:MAG: protein BatD [Gammaproteobacteria bacterium]|nr:protein BatD [Gammaproteobacteria bacterium]